MRISVGVLILVISACSADGGSVAPSPEADVLGADANASDGNGSDAGTSADAEPTSDVPAEDASTGGLAPEAIAASLGITQYVGAITPMVERVEQTDTTYGFDSAEGPICMRGGPFLVTARESAARDDLVIFLQGGGACWSDFCLAVNASGDGIPGVDILNPTLEANPTRDWNAVYLPYCDGSLFAGDVDYDDDLNEKGTRYHRGLANLTAGLEVAKARFPNPPRILLAGSSGGAYGLLLGAPLARHYFPDAELIVMADSGIGLARGDEPEFIETLLTEFRADRFLPEDCESCVDSGHVTGLLAWYLARDPNIRVGMFMAWYDAVLANIFLRIEPADYADAISAQTDPIVAAFPDRFRRFIVDGNQHTSLLADASGIIGNDLGAVELPPAILGTLLTGLTIRGLADTQIGEVSMSTWLGALIDGDLETWVDLQQERGPAPPLEAGE